MHLNMLRQSEAGPANNKTFEVDVMVDGMRFGHGVGKSKRG